VDAPTPILTTSLHQRIDNGDENATSKFDVKKPDHVEPAKEVTPLKSPKQKSTTTTTPKKLVKRAVSRRILQKEEQKVIIAAVAGEKKPPARLASIAESSFESYRVH